MENINKSQKKESEIESNIMYVKWSLCSKHLKKYQLHKKEMNLIVNANKEKQSKLIQEIIDLSKNNLQKIFDELYNDIYICKNLTTKDRCIPTLILNA